VHPCFTEPTDTPSRIATVGSHRWHVACKSTVLKCNRFLLSHMLYNDMHVVSRRNVDLLNTYTTLVESKVVNE
jgi:hypothetical protein